MTKQKTGTREWADNTFNIIRGCPNGCRYCYARHNALRFKRITSVDEWNVPALTGTRAPKRAYKGGVMFPSTHDITPEHLDPCMETIHRLLQTGTQLLIGTKPHIECIRAICGKFSDYREQILFRFSIGAMDQQILDYWEPGAPGFTERRMALSWAYHRGFKTSVSCEPLLDAGNVTSLFRSVATAVTDTIWIGKLNKIRLRCIPGTSEEEILKIEAGQTDERVREIYELLKHEPKVRWKDSYREVLRLKAGE